MALGFPLGFRLNEQTMQGALAKRNTPPIGGLGDPKMEFALSFFGVREKKVELKG